MESLLQTAKREEGAATLVEYAIVLPITLAILCILLFMGYLVYDRACLESASERAALYISKTLADQNYASITSRSASSNEIDTIAITEGSIETKPYRYLLGAFSEDGNESAAEEEIFGMFTENQLISNDSVDVRVDLTSGVFPKVSVKATEEFGVPQLLSSLNLPPFVTIQVESVVYVNEPAEFIRNADYAIDIVEEFGEATGITDKLNSLKSKITFFSSNTE